MQINGDDVWKIVPLAVLLIQGVLAWGGWSLVRRFMTRDSCDNRRKTIMDTCGAIGSRVTEIEKDQIRITTTLDNLPTVQDLASIREAIERMKGELGKDIEGLKVGQEGMRATMQESVAGLGHSLDAVKNQVSLLMECGLSNGGEE